MEIVFHSGKANVFYEIMSAGKKKKELVEIQGGGGGWGVPWRKKTTVI